MLRRVHAALGELARAHPVASPGALEAAVVRGALDFELARRGWPGTAASHLEGTGLLPVDELPSVHLDGVDLARAVEALAGVRRRGVHFTPPALASQVVAVTLGPGVDRPRVVDPACGAGVFLVAALAWLRERNPGEGALSLARLVHGVDLDPLAADAARIALWLASGDPDLPADALSSQVTCGDAVVGPGGPSQSPVDWIPLGRFDAVVGNPPFGNAIEAATRRTPAMKVWARQTFPPFAAGAYDGSLLFLARAVLHLLRDTGRYGLLLPTALLSSDAPWQAWMHARWRPDHLRLLPVDRFPGARVRTAAVVGGAGAGRSLRVVDEEAGREIRRRWPRHTTWYAATRPEVVRVRGAVPLGSVVDVRAGCATGVAYTLRDLVEDDPDGAGPRLVTTGALDRWTCHWGRTQRFLGRDLDHPRWPAGDDLPPALVRARDAQARPKILLGGLTEVLEPWLDAEGATAGVVSTWVLTLRDGAPPERLWEILAALASATLTRLYRQSWGGLAMSGRQVTIKKRALLSLPLPAGAHPDLGAWARARQRGEGDEAWGHHRVAALLGRPDPEADLGWVTQAFPRAL